LRDASRTAAALTARAPLLLLPALAPALRGGFSSGRDVPLRVRRACHAPPVANAYVVFLHRATHMRWGVYARPCCSQNAIVRWVGRNAVVRYDGGAATP
jgi:hypothetical protein